MKVVRFAWAGGEYWGVHEGGRIRRWTDAPYLNGRPTDRVIPADQARLLPPVLPTKIIAVGLNYAPHVAESASADAIPEEPVIFLKPPTALIAHEETITIPRGVDRVDYEGEIGVVIGRGGRRITEENAAGHIFGVTIVNDVTARDLQKRDKQWTRAKGFDTFCPVGPWIETEWDASALQLETRLNGGVRQRGHIRDLIFPISHLIAFISGVMTLQAGDLISTGTPAGVGPLTAGDKVEISVVGIGTLVNDAKDE